MKSLALLILVTQFLKSVMRGLEVKIACQESILV